MSDVVLEIQENYLEQFEVEPLQSYILEDKSKYKKASEVINPKTGRFYIDPYNDFLVGESGGFLPNMSFTFINTHLFREVGLQYEKYKKFVFFDRDTPEYDSFVEREEYRREHGLVRPCKLLPDGTITDLHITGDHYNFINYGWIKKLDWSTVESINSEPDKKYGIPTFMDSQYWVYKIRYFAKLNGFNLIILKSRRKGMSYVEGIGSANTVNLKVSAVLIHAAWDTKFLTKANAITGMALTQLLRYEFNTPFVRGALDSKGVPKGLVKKTDTELITGYRDKYNNARGDLSTLFTVSTKDNPDVASGKDATEIKCDELNTFPNFTEFLKMTNPTTTTGAFKTGIITAFGTGGSKEGNWTEFEKHYYNPLLYDFMPFENIWDENSRNEITGYFMPYWYGLEGIDSVGNHAMDEHGNTIYETAIVVNNLERENKLRVMGHSKDYIDHCSQYANRPSEAFNSGTLKVLSSLELKEHIRKVKHNSEYKNYTDGWIINTDKGVVFKSNTQLANDGHTIHPYIEEYPTKATDDLQGCIRMLHSPYYDETGVIPDNLYFTTYDPYGVSIEDGEYTNKNSLAVVQVWMYPNNISYSSGKILCATWAGRLDSTTAADIVAINITKLYNGKLLPEVDRGTIIATAKTYNFLKYILPDPTIVMNKAEESGKRSYGMVLGTTTRKFDGIVLLKDLLYENISVDISNNYIKRFETIGDLPTLQEFDKFSYRGNYDRVSCSILAAYQINAYITLKLKASSIGSNKRLIDVLKKR